MTESRQREQQIPAEVFPPGEFMKEELEARGWSQADLAEMLGWQPSLVSEIVAGKRAITPELARGLAAAFGTDPQFWMNLERTYQLARVKQPDADIPNDDCHPTVPDGGALRKEET
jgi:HTH-type transcriptional regulator/antitoxin HigA